MSARVFYVLERAGSPARPSEQSISTVELPRRDHVATVLAGRQPSEVCFWTGAGVSIAGPAGLPLGDRLTEEVLMNGCGCDALKAIKQLFKDCPMVDAAGRRKPLPRLEGVLGPLIGSLGEATALAPLAVIAEAHPNSLHRFFAEHVQAGGSHVTVNFDDCLEQALGAGQAVGVRHLHGVYRDGDLNALGVEIGRLSRDLSGAQRRAIDEALDARVLVVCGYSGRDYFDVDPYLRRLRLEGRTYDDLEVVWIDHGDPSQSAVLAGLPSDAPSPLRELSAMNARCRLVRGDTVELLTDIALKWGVTPPHREPITPRAIPRARVSTDKQREAFAATLGYMGAGGPLLEVTSLGHSWRSPALMGSRRSGYEATGRYRRAAFLALAGPGLGSIGDVQRLRYVASLVRQRGNHRLGGALHRVAVKRSRHEPSDSRASDAALEWLHWLREARSRSAPARQRLPRPLAAIAFPAAAGGLDLDPVALWSELASDSAYMARHPHAVAHLYRLRRELPDLAGTDIPVALRLRVDDREATYYESDSFTGYINALRNQLRGDPATTEHDLRQLYDRSRATGDHPGMLKAILLLRASYFSAPAPWRSLITAGYCLPWKLGVVWLWARHQGWPAN
jgi:hypothetical protein